MGGMCSTEGGPPLIQAARDNDIEEVKKLLASGVDINDTDEVSARACLCRHGVSASRG
jgi:hypothetical protein